jgi:hypothetical protein
MSQAGDRIIYLGNGQNGTTAGVSYNGVITRINAPGGWGSNDITINLGGTPTVIIGARRDPMLGTGNGAAAHPNGAWRMFV